MKVDVTPDNEQGHVLINDRNKGKYSVINLRVVDFLLIK